MIVLAGGCDGPAATVAGVLPAAARVVHSSRGPPDRRGAELGAAAGHAPHHAVSAAAAAHTLSLSGLLADGRTMSRTPAATLLSSRCCERRAALFIYQQLSRCSAQHTSQAAALSLSLSVPQRTPCEQRAGCSRPCPAHGAVFGAGADQGFWVRTAGRACFVPSDGLDHGEQARAQVRGRPPSGRGAVLQQGSMRGRRHSCTGRAAPHTARDASSLQQFGPFGLSSAKRQA